MTESDALLILCATTAFGIYLVCSRSRDPLQLSVIAVVLMLLVTIPYWCPVFINPTSSLPTGMYRYTHEPLHRGVIIGFPQPHKPGVRTLNLHLQRSLMKYVAAMPGDVVVITPSGIFIDGQRWPNSQPPSPPDTLDRRLLGRHVVPPGYLWALGTNAESFDSRYFGEVPVLSITTTARPLKVFSIPDTEFCNDIGSSPNPCYLRADSPLAK
jgi:conjugative transfer signal peptidase TraF